MTSISREIIAAVDAIAEAAARKARVSLSHRITLARLRLKPVPRCEADRSTS